MRFIHIGIHKTGSTYLQRGLFDRCDLAVIGTPSVSQRMHDATRLLWSRDHGHLNLGAWRQHFDEIVEEVGEDPARLGLSDENLSGHMWTGIGTVTVADRLATLWPEARILIVLRDPVDYVMSAYDEWCRLGGSAAFRRLLEDRCTPGSAVLRRVDYGALVQTYVDRFGGDRVLAVPYELLVDDPCGFVDRIVDHCGLDPAAASLANVRWNPRAPGWVRTVTRFEHFTGWPMSIEWDRSRRRRPWWGPIDDRLQRSARRRVERSLAALDAVDDLLPPATGQRRGYEWPGDLARFQGGYGWTTKRDEGAASIP